MKLTKTLRTFGIIAALFGSAATQSFALPNNEVEYEWYSDAEFTNQVGYYILGCDGSHYREGKIGRYAVHSSTPCQTGGPMEMACYFDGRLTMCPLNICDTELVTCN